MFNFFRRKRYVLKHRLLGTYFGPLSKNGRFDGLRAKLDAIAEGKRDAQED